MMIRVTGRDGSEQELDAIEGWRVMEIIRDHGMTDPNVAIKAECGGSLACATCHVYVDAAWVDKLVPASEDEIYMMDEAFAVQDNSRLSCQIIMNEELDGLQVTLAPGTEP
ncbi:MAG: fdx [Alphaproteobacteria bacterium]|jgi:2Fe-2S ferredoxin|nr:fdx [Alphaproteobacteria bacterium]